MQPAARVQERVSDQVGDGYGGRHCLGPGRVADVAGMSMAWTVVLAMVAGATRVAALEMAGAAWA